MKQFMAILVGLLMIAIVAPTSGAQPTEEILPVEDVMVDGCGISSCSPVPFAPTVSVKASWAAAHGGSSQICTGTYEDAATGTAGGSAEGGVAGVEFTVHASVTVSILKHYTFACDVSMVTQAIGKNGFVRLVATETQTVNAFTTEEGSPCEYTGLPGDSQCTTEEYPVLSDAYAGEGIAGPTWGLPVEVEVCPPSSGAWKTRGVSYGYQGLPVTVTSAWTGWDCERFAIHYASSGFGGVVAELYAQVHGI